MVISGAVSGPMRLIVLAMKFAPTERLSQSSDSILETGSSSNKLDQFSHPSIQSWKGATLPELDVEVAKELAADWLAEDADHEPRLSRNSFAAELELVIALSCDSS